MTLMRRVQCGTLYKLLGININNGCNSFVVPGGENEEKIIPTTFRENTILWHQS